MPSRYEARQRKARGRLAAVLAGTCACVILAACQPAAAPAGRQAAAGDAVVVASFNFPESEVLAAIYGLAVRQAGIPVRLQLGLGPRELVQPALEQGLVDVVPEYLGTALTSLGSQPAVSLRDRAAVRAALARALARRHIQVMAPAAAQDQNGVAVTRGTARRLNLRRVSDLWRSARRMTFGGPPECPARPYCLPGLHRVYGLSFAAFLPLDTEQQRVTALSDGAVGAAALFTTDGNLAAGDLVLLADDRHLQPAENVVPVIRSAVLARYGTRLARAVDTVSGQLTSAGLSFLNWRIEVAGHPVLAEARGWLERHGILPRPG